MLMGYTRQRKGWHYLILGGDKGFDFVRCRICGDHRRVINSQHLSKHDTDRETYMEEYHLTPDELMAKDFRVLQSSRRISARIPLHSRPGNPRRDFELARSVFLINQDDTIAFTFSRLSEIDKGESKQPLLYLVLNADHLSCTIQAADQ